MSWEGLTTMKDVEMDKLVCENLIKLHKIYGDNFATVIINKLIDETKRD